MLDLTRASTESFGGFYIAPTPATIPAKQAGTTACWPDLLARALLPAVFVAVMIAGVAFVVDDAVANGVTTVVALDA